MLSNAIITSVMPPGLIIGGPVADWLGVRSLYFIASGAWLIVISLALFSKSLMNLKNQEAEDMPTAN